MRLFEFISVLHTNTYIIIISFNCRPYQILSSQQYFLCARVEKRDRVNFVCVWCVYVCVCVCVCVCSTKTKVHVVKGRKVPKHCDIFLLFCEAHVLCQSKANSIFGSQGIL